MQVYEDACGTHQASSQEPHFLEPLTLFTAWLSHPHLFHPFPMPRLLRPILSDIEPTTGAKIIWVRLKTSPDARPARHGRGRRYGREGAADGSHRVRSQGLPGPTHGGDRE